MAAVTGGRVIRLADEKTWPTRGERDAIQVQEQRSLDLWSGFVLVGLLVAVLAADWLVRLLRGFV